jgi:hypothetical protein
MHGVWVLVHVMGFVLWLGGGVASMVSGVAAKKFAPAERLAVYRAVGRIHKALIAPGALFVVLSGIVLLMPLMRAGALAGPGAAWLHTMLGAGLLGALIVLFFSVPTANRLARLVVDPRGELPESFAGLRKRQAIVATIGGALGIVALIAATVGRY